MKPYGLQRSQELGDLGTGFAEKSSVYRHAGKGGDIRAQNKSNSKQKLRRAIKRAERGRIKRQINDASNENSN